MTSLKEFEQQVKSLIAAENWPEAYKICNQILSYDPENSTFLKLKNLIEKEVKQINQKSIHNELQRLEQLLKEHRYEEYLKSIAPLQTYVSDFPEVGEKILQAKKLLDQEYQNRKSQALNEISKEIEEKGDNLDFESTIQRLDQFYKLDFDSKIINKLQDKVRKKWIALQIKQNQGLLESQRYEDIIIFLLKLKKIDDQNHQILSLIKKVKEQYQLQKIENKKDYIFKTIEEIKTLYITKKYDLCMELCERILEIDPQNIQAKQYFQKAKNKADKYSERFIANQIFENYSQFPKSKFYQEGNFIKI